VPAVGTERGKKRRKGEGKEGTLLPIEKKTSALSSKKGTGRREEESSSIMVHDGKKEGEGKGKKKTGPLSAETHGKREGGIWSDFVS